MKRSRRRLFGWTMAAAALVVGPFEVGAQPSPPTGTTDSGLAEVVGPVTSQLRPGVRPASVRHRFPMISSGYRYGRSHHDYPATDVAAVCGTPLVAVTDGIVWEVERIDRYDATRDVPAYRGGRTVVLDGDDGVRYLYAHLSSIATGLAVGQRVSIGTALGTVGTTGRSTGCHLHLGLSPQCRTRRWEVLQGSVWPWPYLDAWLGGENLNPGPEVRSWRDLHPGVCDGTAVVEPAAGIDLEVDEFHELVVPNRDALPGGRTRENGSPS